MFFMMRREIKALSGKGVVMVRAEPLLRTTRLLTSQGDKGMLLLREASKGSTTTTTKLNTRTQIPMLERQDPS